MKKLWLRIGVWWYDMKCKCKLKWKRKIKLVHGLRPYKQMGWEFDERETGRSL